jgi:hypothetical protein
MKSHSGGEEKGRRCEVVPAKVPRGFADRDWRSASGSQKRREPKPRRPSWSSCDKTRCSIGTCAWQAFIGELKNWSSPYFKFSRLVPPKSGGKGRRRQISEQNKGVTQGTLRLDPIALYNSTGNEFIAPALWTQTSVKDFLDSFATVSRFSQRHRTGDFEPQSRLRMRLER